MVDERDGDDRESIWSVPQATKTAYFVLFIVHFIAGIGLLIWRGERGHETPADYALYIWLKSGSIALGSAAAALIYAEVGRYLLVLSRSLEVWLEKKREERREEGRVEGRVEGREEGRVEADAEWSAWLARMREAQAKGEPFDEPTPLEKNGQA